MYEVPDADDRGTGFRSGPFDDPGLPASLGTAGKDKFLTGSNAAMPPASLDVLFTAANDRQQVRRRAYLHRADEPVEYAFLVTAGWFGRFRLNTGGTGAFTGLYMRGDVIGLDALFTGVLHDEVTALMDGVVLRVPLRQLSEHVAGGGALASEAVRRLAADTVFLREVLFAVGAQSSNDRMSTFIMQTYDRVVAAGLTLPGGGFRLPLTQVQLGAVTGLTSVHVNRVLRRLRDDGMIEFQGGIVRVLDLPALRRAVRQRL